MAQRAVRQLSKFVCALLWVDGMGSNARLGAWPGLDGVERIQSPYALSLRCSR